MSYEGNIYYYPEKNGLEIVSAVDVGETYEFDIVVIFRDVKTGQLLIGSDSGCSCPTPFDDVSREDLRPISGKAEALEYVLDSFGWDDEARADLVSGW